MTQQAQQEYQRWLSRAPEFAKEINAVANDEEMEDRFGRILDFGTGGLRGKMGAGSNRMNNYTVARATQGLANYLLATAENPSVVIARDTRNNSAEYSKKAAQVLCAAGIKVYWYENPRPTPMLSHATRYYKASAGIVITASHNEKCDNGYKVYNADGGQITDIAAGNILAQILDIDLFDGWKCLSLEQAIADELLTIIPDNNDCDNAYFELLRQSIIRKDLGMLHGNELSILYTPLYGSGNGPVRHALDKMGYGNVSVIDEQAAPNGDFPGLEKPNPEDIPVYAMAIEQAKKDRPDLIFATDPDCDRIGVLTQDNKGEYSVLTGNQTGCLLVEYLLESHIEKGTLPPDAALIKTIVTTDLAKKICGEYNVKLIDVLTGFKYIGEKIYEWNDENKDSTRCSFLYGFEESYGHLTHTFARDKDAVAAGVIIAQMALWHKLNNRTLYDALQALWAKYGYAKEHLQKIDMTVAKREEIMKNLRKDWRRAFADEKPVVIEDYLSQERVCVKTGEKTSIDLPCSNVMKFIFADGAWLVLRPSGTEPMIKLYTHAIAASEDAAGARIEGLLKIGAVVVSGEC